MEIEGSIEIAASPDKVWPFLVESEKIKQRFGETREFQYTSPQKGGIGSTFSIQEKVGSRIFNLHFIITEWIEHRVFAFRMISGDFYNTYEERWTLEPTPQGSRFSFRDRIELRGRLFGWLLEIILKPRTMDTAHEMLHSLKRLVESSSPRSRSRIPFHMTS